MVGPEAAKAKLHSYTLIPPVLWIRIMPWKQTIGQRKTPGLRSLSQCQKRLPTLHSWLAQILLMISLVRLLLKSPVAIVSSLSRAQRFRCQNTETAGKRKKTRTAQNWPWWWLHPVRAGRTLWPCYGFCTFIQVLIWKWKWYDGRKKEEELDG